MAATIKAESTLTDRYQTTVPEVVRRTLGIGKRDKIQYTLTPSGEMIITRAAREDADDPVLGQFLHFLATDMAKNPDSLRPMESALFKRVQSLVGHIDVDLDAPLPSDED